MSFTGDLEHLSIVDVIQLLNSTRKSGTLCVRGRKAENQIVFHNGFIVGANHSNAALRIGNILVEMKAITPEALKRALEGQQSAGASRKPLIATLIEGGLVNKKAALKGLEKLIQVTVIEMVSWRRGTFSLDVDTLAISEEYRYFPENLHQEICLDAQMVLMDALRIYDEKIRDGEIIEEDDDEELDAWEQAGQEEGPSLSADDLGLADLDELEEKIPEPFSSLEFFDPCEIHRQKIKENLPGVAPEDHETLVSFLMQSPVRKNPGAGPLGLAGQNRAVILFSQDELLVHTLMTVCKQDGMLIFVTREQNALDPIIDQSLSKGMVPVLVFDAPTDGEEAFSREAIAELRRQKKQKNPQITAVQLAGAGDGAFSLNSICDGVRAVLPKPQQTESTEFIAEFILFLGAFREYLKGYFIEQEQKLPSKFRDGISSLRDLKEPPEVSLALLGFASEMFERTLTFVVRKSELVAERGIGINGRKSEGASPPLKFTVPLEKPSRLREVVGSGSCFFGELNDEVVQEYVFQQIGAPLSPEVLLLPMQSRGRTITVTYADFGAKPASAIQLDLLEVLASHAGTVLENCLYRKQLEKIVP